MSYILPDFVTWYFNGDPIRTNHLYASLRRGLDHACNQDILRQTQKKMARLLPTNTFEVFRFFNEVKECSRKQHESFNSDELLKTLSTYGAPDCVRLLHLSSCFHRKLRLVNKFYNTSLCVVEKTVVCCSAGDVDRGLVCFALVDVDTAKTFFSYNSGSTLWLMGNVSGQEGASWKLGAVDEHHVKIFTVDG